MSHGAPCWQCGLTSQGVGVSLELNLQFFKKVCSLPPPSDESAQEQRISKDSTLDKRGGICVCPGDSEEREKSRKLICFVARTSGTYLYLNTFKKQSGERRMSSAGTTAERQGGKGTKRAPEEERETQQDEPVNGDETGPPPTKTAKPNPSPGEDMSPPAPGGVVVAVKAEGTGPTDSERVEAEALSSLGLAVGTRLEVMWLLEDDDKSVEKVSEQTAV